MLRCYKSRIVREYEYHLKDDKLVCNCGNLIGIDKGPHIKMIKKGFVYTGKKRN